jgi:hypothetical protein
MALTVSRRVRELEATDVIQYVNNSGSAIANNQVIFIAGDSGYGIVAVSQEVVAATAGTIGSAIVKGIVELPTTAIAITQGEMVYAATAGTSVSLTTASGSYSIGMAVETVASTVAYVKVDLNYGPTAFKVW